MRFVSNFYIGLQWTVDAGGILGHFACICRVLIFMISCPLSRFSLCCFCKHLITKKMLGFITFYNWRVLSCYVNVTLNDSPRELCGEILTCSLGRNFWVICNSSRATDILCTVYTGEGRVYFEVNTIHHSSCFTPVIYPSNVWHIWTTCFRLKSVPYPHTLCLWISYGFLNNNQHISEKHWPISNCEGEGILFCDIFCSFKWW